MLLNESQGWNLCLNYLSYRARNTGVLVREGLKDSLKAIPAAGFEHLASPQMRGREQWEVWGEGSSRRVEEDEFAAAIVRDEQGELGVVPGGEPGRIAAWRRGWWVDGIPETGKQFVDASQLGRQSWDGRRGRGEGQGRVDARSGRWGREDGVGRAGVGKPAWCGEGEGQGCKREQQRERNAHGGGERESEGWVWVAGCGSDGEDGRGCER